MTTLKELAAMLDAATGPSLELDAVVCEVFSLYPAGTERAMNTDGASNAWAGNAIWWEALPLTSSIDAALALVERLGFYMISLEWDRLGVDAHLGHRDEALRSWKRVAPTAPLAILKALVAALIAQEKTDEA